MAHTRKCAILFTRLLRGITECIVPAGVRSSGGELRISILRMSLDILRYRLCRQFVPSRPQMALVDVNRLVD